MNERIEVGFMVFVEEGREGVGAVRGVSNGAFVLYVENAGEFVVPLSAVKKVHDSKVMLDRTRLHTSVLKAIGHMHDREDPGLAG